MVQLQSVFDAIALSRVLYASPAWRGNLSAWNIANLQQLFAKAKRWKIIASNYDIDVLLEHFSNHLCILQTVCIICFQINVVTRMQWVWDPVTTIFR